MDMRQIRGLEICKQKQVQKTTDGWLVKSQSASGYYRVGEDFSCNCPDAEFHKATCKHAFAVRYFLQVEKKTPQGVKTERVRLTYKQAWSAYNAAQTSEVRLFDELLKDLVQAVPDAAYSFGRPRLNKKDMVFCAIQKAYSQLSARRAVSLFGFAQERQQIGAKPHFNSVNNYMKDETLTPYLYGLLTLSALPLKAVESKFAIDSTGFRTTCFGQYAEEKYDLQRDHKWVKAHACVGVQTNVITSVRITKSEGEGSGDAPNFPFLVKETAEGGFTIEEVSADKAYSSRDNIDAVHEVGATPYIPFKEGSTGKSKGSLLWKKAFHFFQMNSAEFYEHYHARSNVESTFAAVKKKFGDTLKSKTYPAQENELLCKLIAYNVTCLIMEMHELGIKPNFEREQKVAGLNK